MFHSHTDVAGGTVHRKVHLFRAGAEHEHICAWLLIRHFRKHLYVVFVQCSLPVLKCLSFGLGFAVISVS
jgi:hypothetical protein